MTRHFSEKRQQSLTSYPSVMHCFVVLLWVSYASAIVTPGLDIGIDFRKDGGILASSDFSPDGNVLYILTDTKIIAINTSNRQKLGSYT